MPAGTEDFTSPYMTLLTLSRQKSDSTGQVIETDRYFNLAGISYNPGASGWASLGSQGTNYDASTTSYDSGGRPSTSTSADGTISTTVYNALSEPVSKWVGTASNDMVETEVDSYDADDNLTEQEKLPGGGASPQTTLNYYDFRDRLVASKNGVLLNGDGTENTSGETSAVNHGLISYTVYDNLNEPTEIDTYAGDGVAVSTSGGLVSAPSSSLLRSNKGISYDAQGRVYRTSVYSVNPTNGDVSTDSIDTNTWYDLRGNVIKSQKTAQAATKTAYDGADRPTIVYSTDAADDASAGTTGNWSDAGNVSGDKVLEQNESAYDADGNTIETIDRQRFNTDTGTGSLGDAGSGSTAARVYYTASFYDGANRLTATVNVGTNTSPTTGLPVVYTRPSSVPARSDTVLVNSYTYNPAGWVNEATDPRGIVTKTNYDALGRTTRTIVDYTVVGGIGGTPTNDSNQTTAYSYDGDDHVLTQTAILPGSAEEQTQYNYGVTVGTGSDLNSNDLLGSVYYPDLTTGVASSGQAESYTYDAVGEKTGMTDRNGTTHAYSYDLLGRQILDDITTLGSGVSDWAMAIGTNYDSAGRPYLFTTDSDSEATTVVNQVEDIYNGLGQVITEYQANDGEVDPDSTPSVQTGYSTIANGSRKSDLVYPNGRQIDYNYAPGLDASISRLSSITEDEDDTVLEGYQYLGLGTVVERNHPEDGINLTYVSSSTTGDGGDQYVGLDRFGRVVDQKWVNGSGTAVDEYQYTYDRDGNALSKVNAVSPSLSEVYTYDDLNRLTGMTRGTIGGTASKTETYSLDALGNQLLVTTNGTTVSDTFNRQNEMTAQGTSTLAYDADGNMTTGPASLPYTYDAWNRTVLVGTGPHVTMGGGGSHTSANPIYGPHPDFPGVIITPPSAAPLDAQYRYDALGRRIEDGDHGTHEYYDGWQVIQESPPTGSSSPTQYVWSPLYANALIERDTNYDGNTSTGLDGLEYRLYVSQDANWDTTGLYTADGTATDHFIYDPYGAIDGYLNGSFASGGGGNNFVYLWQGGKLDSDGEYYFEHRDENPLTRDWAEQDPAGYVAGLNRYSFANANPIVLNDPDGFQPRDKYFGRPDRFWDWYHRQIKQPGDPDLTKPEADDYEQQWEDEGKPDGEGKTQKKLICSLATIADITAQIAAEAAAAEARAAADRLRQLGKEIGNHIGD